VSFGERRGSLSHQQLIIIEKDRIITELTSQGKGLDGDMARARRKRIEGQRMRSFSIFSEKTARTPQKRRRTPLSEHRPGERGEKATAPKGGEPSSYHRKGAVSFTLFFRQGEEECLKPTEAENKNADKSRKKGEERGSFVNLRKKGPAPLCPAGEGALRPVSKEGAESEGPGAKFTNFLFEKGGELTASMKGRSMLRFRKGKCRSILEEKREACELTRGGLGGETKREGREGTPTFFLA